MSWINEELSYVDLEDSRLEDRLGKVLGDLSNHPSLSIPSASRGHAEMVGAYRFFSNPKVTFESVLESHVEQTKVRASHHPVVLLVGDSTELSNRKPQENMKGVGYLSSARRGTLLHPLVSFSPEGIPLGTLSAELINRPKRVFNKKRRTNHNTPIEEKESYRWLLNQYAAIELSEEIPETQFVTIYDSEADMFEVLSEFNNRGAKVDFIVRGCHDRVIINDKAEDEKSCLYDQVNNAPIKFKKKLEVRRKNKKISCNTKNRYQTRKARKAEFEIRTMRVKIAPPKHKKKLSNVEANIVLVSESKAPKGEKKIEWMLITSLPINNDTQIRKVIKYYCTRWMIEIFFKVLKSGCQIEQRRFKDIKNFEPCLAVYLIIAWRILYTCYLSRECPNLPCDAIFSQEEWKTVYVIYLKKKPPKISPSLIEIATLVAQMGGYIKRKNSPPGPKTFWIGFQRLQDLVLAWNAFGPETSF